MGVNKDCRNFRVEPDSKQDGGELQRLVADYSGLIRDRESVKVDDAVKNVIFILP
jgi:hypothetical protein